MKNWKKMEKAELKEWLTKLLQSNSVTIKFIKKEDGTERVMNATLHERLVANTSGSGRKENSDIINVTDTTLDEWRSIRLDSIKEISFDNENK